MEFILTIFKVLLYSGMVLVLIGTIAVNILSSKLDAKKDKKIMEMHKTQSESEKLHFQELGDGQKHMYNMLQSLGKLDDPSALITCLAEFEKVFEQNRRRSNTVFLVPGSGIFQQSGATYDPNLISALSNLLNQDDPSVKKAAEGCLQAIGTDDALKALQEQTSK